MADDDRLTAALAKIRRRHYKTSLPTGEPVCQSDRHAWPCHAYRLLAAVDTALEGHDPVQVYASADECRCTRPYEPDAEDLAAFGPGSDAQREFDAWTEEHPSGTALTPDGEDPGMICLATPREIICPACSQARYGEGWDWDGAYVEAADCAVRPAITRALTGEETAGA
jgi:hypothetical protein